MDVILSNIDETCVKLVFLSKVSSLFTSGVYWQSSLNLDCLPNDW